MSPFKDLLSRIDRVSDRTANLADLSDALSTDEPLDDTVDNERLVEQTCERDNDAGRPSPSGDGPDEPEAGSDDDGSKELENLAGQFGDDPGDVEGGRRPTRRGQDRSFVSTRRHDDPSDGHRGPDVLG